MQSYHHFTQEERESLLGKKREGKSIREIARELGCSPSSICREVKRNSNEDGNYSAFGGTAKYLVRRKECKRKHRFEKDIKLKAWVEEKLRAYWSPETIVAVWKRDHDNAPLSYSTIYRAIAEGRLGCSAKEHLRRRGKPYYGARKKFNTIHPEHTINERPEIVNARQRIGDWEGDTIMGGRGKGYIFTGVDRKSRYLVAGKVDTRSADQTAQVMETVLASEQKHTLTLDNGAEFAKHKILSEALDIPIYFADPHSPWQRPTNENTNGLLRFFFPKGTDLTAVSQETLDAVVTLLNNRPRKCLGWLSPADVYFSRCCT